jgi:16S rRNA (uracil1498-N3)-methyltransferase
MPQVDFRSPRLFVAPPLSEGTRLALDRNQANYLGNVLRLSIGDQVRVFNGREGEWLATIAGQKRPDGLLVGAQTRVQPQPADLTYVFAPLKHARLDYVVQKAVEMGAAALQPVTTRFTQVSRINLDRMRANVIEAAEQCGILGLATVEMPVSLEQWLERRPVDRLLVFCDEDAAVTDPVAALAGHRADPAGIDVLIGPEGGFADDERGLLQRQRRVARLALGPRILRADTAAVAALALVQAVLGDWGAA